MEEIYEFQSYFPQKFSDARVEEYINHHFDHLIRCTQNNLFASGYSHLHILYMVFVYLQILRISKEKNAEFNFCWIGFPSEEKQFREKPTSPFLFAAVNEKAVFRFFRLVEFDDGTIGNLSQPVTARNGRLHAKGKIFFENQEDFDRELKSYLQKMESIVRGQNEFLSDLYLSVVSTFDSDYKITSDDIESDFVVQYSFSEYELRQFAENKTDVVSKYIINEM